jgi:hypothetical protein
MTISYPLSTANFIDLLPLPAIVPKLVPQQEMSNQSSGAVLGKDLGPELWMADIQTTVMNDDDAARAQALIEALQGSQQTFWCYNTKRRYPKTDPTGSIVGSNTVKIKAVSGSYGLQLKGLPASYTLTVGDMISVAARYGYHRVLETVTSDGSGDTATFSVASRIRNGEAVDDVVTLKIPTFLACIVPGSVDIQSDVKFTRISFKACQVVL